MRDSTVEPSIEKCFVCGKDLDSDDSEEDSYYFGRGRYVHGECEPADPWPALHGDDATPPRPLPTVPGVICALVKRLARRLFA